MTASGSQAEVAALIFDVCFTPSIRHSFDVRHFRFGQKATWLRSSGLESFAMPVTRLALVAFDVFSGTGHAPR
jgi:hypothetical protein